MDKKPNEIHVNLIPETIQYSINSYTTINAPYIVNNKTFMVFTDFRRTAKVFPTT